eukprot:ANDGO_05448.mRNA.1 hypothetical protein
MVKEQIGNAAASAAADSNSNSSSKAARRTACDSCKSSHVACSHELPCARCVAKSVVCVYSSARSNRKRLWHSLSCTDFDPSVELGHAQKKHRFVDPSSIPNQLRKSPVDVNVNMNVKHASSAVADEQFADPHCSTDGTTNSSSSADNHILHGVVARGFSGNGMGLVTTTSSSTTTVSKLPTVECAELESVSTSCAPILNDLIAHESSVKSISMDTPPENPRALWEKIQSLPAGDLLTNAPRSERLPAPLPLLCDHDTLIAYKFLDLFIDVLEFHVSNRAEKPLDSDRIASNAKEAASLVAGKAQVVSYDLPGAQSQTSPAYSPMLYTKLYSIVLSHVFASVSQLVEQTKSVVILMDGENTLLYVNGRIEQYSEFRVGDLLNKTLGIAFTFPSERLETIFGSWYRSVENPQVIVRRSVDRLFGNRRCLTQALFLRDVFGKLELSVTVMTPISVFPESVVRAEDFIYGEDTLLKIKR